MKTLTKLMSLLLVCSTLLCYSCSSDDDNTYDENAYEIVGLWKAEFNINGGETGTCELQVNKDNSVSYYWKSNKLTESGTSKYTYYENSHKWYLNGGSLPRGYNYLALVGNKLIASSNSTGYYNDDIVFYREGESGGSDKYSGKDFVGTWQGSDGSDVFAIQLDADGTYTDWLVINGNKTNKATGQYTVEGNTLTAPGNSNLIVAWTNKPFTISFSGKNQMTLTNSLMSDYNQKLVLTRK